MSEGIGDAIAAGVEDAVGTETGIGTDDGAVATLEKPEKVEEKAEETDRFLRQRAIIPREKMLQQTATVIGVGAGGRQVAWMLASLGVPKIQLIDHDAIELHNVTTQGYYHEQIGMKKVDAVKDLIEKIDPAIKVGMVRGKFTPNLVKGNAVFCCVDSITTRADIWHTIGKEAPFWVDGRMRAETMLVYSATDEASREFYEETLFPEAEAQVGACTGRGTIYTASIVAGLMVAQFAKYLRGMPTDHEQIFNLLAGEISVKP